MKKLIAHEAPFSIMEKVRRVTDYDYALVHIFEENEEYFNFFRESLEMGRTVILDNSIFELGTAFHMDKFASWIVKLKPTEFIVPDVLEDSIATIQSFYRWCDSYSNLKSGRRIGVIQGRDYNEIVTCYREIEPYCDKVAISFNYSYYEYLFPHPNKFVSWAMGRVLLISKLCKDRVINKSKPHHLLGISLPQEMMYYRSPEFDFIESVDSSNPIIAGMFGIRYDKGGLWDKNIVKVNDLLHKEIDGDDYEDIYSNICQFRWFVNGE